MIAFLKLAGLLLAVLLSTGLKIPVAYVLIGCSVIAGFIFFPIGEIPQAFLHVLSSWNTWRYILTLWGVLLLEATMNKNGMLKSLAKSATNLFTDKRLATIILPSIIGFLPSVGGAYFSAPLVNEVASDMSITPVKKNFVNYWFRHIWENAVPLYPGVIMASAITGYPIALVMAYQIPITLVGLFSGFYVGFKGVPKVNGSKGGPLWPRLSSFLKDVWPVFLAIVFVVSIPSIYAPFAVLSVVLISWTVIKPKKEIIWNIVKTSFRVNYFIILLGSVLFNEVLQGSTAAADLSSWFQSTGMQPVFVAILLPVLVGLLIGVTVAFVGITFPIIAALAGTGSYGIFALAYAVGIVAILYSPIHVCVILTCDYFKTKMSDLFKLMIVPATVQVILGVILWWLIR